MTTGVQVQDGTFYAGIGGGIVGSGDNFRAILQSFQGVYSLGRYLIEPNTAYSSALLECYLKHIVLPDVQAQLFGYPLSGNAHEHRAGYKYAILKTDKEIWESLYADAVRGVACYRSLLEVTMPATTCLFSGRATGEGTTEEHTLLRAIGGRFRSQTAASSSFNNATSNILDAPLAAPYALIMNALAPLLSSEHQPGGLDLIGEPGRRLVLDPGAVARQRGVHVEARDPKTGRPIAMSAEDPLALAAMARRVGIPDERLEKTMIPPVASQYAERRQSILSPWAETAVLKCALLTFDHLLGSRPDAFTRSFGLKGVRDEILVIVNGAHPQPLISATSWGIDNSRRAALLELADQYRPRPRSMFENVLLVSAQHGGNVDLHCLLAGVDVYRFRVCNRWDGAPFNILCGAGMLVGEVPYGPIYVADAMPLGAPTDLRSVFPEGTSQEVVEDISRRINAERQRAFVEAVLLVETMADEFVVKNICDLEAVGASTLEQALRQRLEHLYADSVFALRQPQITAIVNEAISSLSHDVGRAPATTVAPTEWLGIYRAALKRLRNEVGLPVLLTEVATHVRLANDD